MNRSLSLGHIVISGLLLGLPVYACSSSDDVSGGRPTDAGSDAGNDSSTGDADAAPVNTCPEPTAGPTLHRYDVEGDAVWTAAGSPHIVEYNVSVRNGATLTIEPCATVLLRADQKIAVAYPGTPNVGGTLIAEGTAERPITFAGENGARWGSLYVYAPGTARLAYVTFQNGGADRFDNHSTINVLGDSVLPADPLLFVDHVTVRGSLGHGVWMQRGSTFIAGSRDLTITDSGSSGADAGEAPPYPIQIEEHAIDALPTGSYTGNARDEILIHTSGYGIAGGGLTVNATLRNRGVAYHIGRSVGDSLVIGRAEPDGPLATLTIEPGVVLKFEPKGPTSAEGTTSLVVQGVEGTPLGAVRALGSAADPIVFTSAASTPQPDDWRGLRFRGAVHESNRLDHTRIEYAGGWCSCGLLTCSDITDFDAAVVFFAQPPSAFITNTVFSNIHGHGVTQGFDGSFVNFRPTNTFDSVSSCPQTLPRLPSGCPDPEPPCDGL